MTEQDEARSPSTLGITILTGEDAKDWRQHVPASAIAIGFSTHRADEDQEEDDESWRGLVTSYGGGFYGTLAALTFVALELRDLWADWQAAGGLADFLAGLTLAWLFDFGVSSMVNAVFATIWPVVWWQSLGLLGFGLAAAAWIVFEAGRRLASRSQSGDGEGEGEEEAAVGKASSA